MEDLVMSKVPYETIEEYYQTCEQMYVERMEAIRSLAKAILPTMEEGIRWGMPTIFYHGSVFQMCQCKGYVSFAPGADAIQHFQDALTSYKTTKCAIHLPMTQELDEALVKQIITYCMQQNEQSKR